MVLSETGTLTTKTRRRGQRLGQSFRVVVRVVRCVDCPVLPCRATSIGEVRPLPQASALSPVRCCFGAVLDANNDVTKGLDRRASTRSVLYLTRCMAKRLSSLTQEHMHARVLAKLSCTLVFSSVCSFQCMNLAVGCSDGQA